MAVVSVFALEGSQIGPSKIATRGLTPARSRPGLRDCEYIVISVCTALPMPQATSQIGTAFAERMLLFTVQYSAHARFGDGERGSATQS